METNYRKTKVSEYLATFTVLGGVALWYIFGLILSIGIPILCGAALWKFVFG